MHPFACRFAVYASLVNVIYQAPNEGQQGSAREFRGQDISSGVRGEREREGGVRMEERKIEEITSERLSETRRCCKLNRLTEEKMFWNNS